MDMTDLKQVPASASSAVEKGAAALDRVWKDTVTTLSAEMGAPLTLALERVEALIANGRIDRAGLQALYADLRQARQLTTTGQQLARLASGQIRQTPERLPLNGALQQVIDQRAADVRGRGVTVRPVLQAADVIVDAALLFNLTDALLRWSVDHAHAEVELRVELKSWPALARLGCRFVHTPPQALADEFTASPSSRPLETVNWRLIEETAKAMGLGIEHQDKRGAVQVRFEFPRTVVEPLEGLSTIELNDGPSPMGHTKPLAGSQVLVVASRRDVRVQIRDAIRNMGLVVDFASSIEEAREFCMGGLPQAVVIESVLRGDRFNRFRQEVQANEPSVVFLEILEEGSVFEISGYGGANMARVGRDAIAQSLPSALMFELSKTA